MKKLKSIKVRIYTVLALIFVILIIIIIKLFGLQIIEGDIWKEKGEKQYKSEYPVKAKRGKIMTNDEEILAYDEEIIHIEFDPTLVTLKKIDNLMELFKKYIPSFDSEKVKKEILEKRKQKQRSMKIENVIDYKIKKFISDEQSKDSDLKSGVFFKTNFIRNYVKNNAFKEILGYLNNESKGVYGIEKYYDEKLIGLDGLIEGFRIPINLFSIPSMMKKKKQYQQEMDII